MIVWVRVKAMAGLKPSIMAASREQAGTAPSGANLQPWQFVMMSDPTVKAEIRVAAEDEEQEFLCQPGAAGLARSPGSTRYRLEQVVPGNCPLPDRELRAELRRPA